MDYSYYGIDTVEYSKFSRVGQGRLMDQAVSVYIWIRLQYCWFSNELGQDPQY